MSDDYRLNLLSEELDKYKAVALKLKAENEELKKENEEINSRMSDVIYRATGGRLCYSTYTLDAIEHAFQDQLEILSDRKTEELENEYEELEKEYEELHIKYAGCKTANTAIQAENEQLKETCDGLLKIQFALADEGKKYEKALEEIREIINKSCKQCKNEYLSEDYCSGQSDCYEIMQVINEVLEERVEE